jgi:hypothetical protein
MGFGRILIRDCWEIYLYLHMKISNLHIGRRVHYTLFLVLSSTKVKNQELKIHELSERNWIKRLTIYCWTWSKSSPAIWKRNVTVSIITYYTNNSRRNAFRGLFCMYPWRFAKHIKLYSNFRLLLNTIISCSDYSCY